MTHSEVSSSHIRTTPVRRNFSIQLNITSHRDIETVTYIKESIQNSKIIIFKGLEVLIYYTP